MDHDLELRAVGYDHPDAVALVARVQLEYAERYGSPDEGAVDLREFDAPNGLFLVGYDDRQTPVVTGAWRRSSEQALGATNAAELKRMYVVPEARGRGFARRILAELEATAAAAGHDALLLGTGTMQPEAIALYLSEGYEEIPVFGFYAGHVLARSYGKRIR
ncbi:GNAT family N-acetyltransferase [Nocardioides sp. WS12]|uniref:GNAT family N-acetyltransferase n=1 Tax=Nocardioides sp. WS12 TaxID=2486272 RepID=UPI0015FBEDA9|nr:GNAT family N-acetyltransferase [Nocardioides sp. WS12]